MTLHDQLEAAIKERLVVAQAATQGEWFYDSYSRIYSGVLAKTFDEWADPLIDAGHELEKYGNCPSCGDWKEPPYVPSLGLGHGCRYFNEAYDREPRIAAVPAHHGDTATRRHEADAKFIAANGPDRIIRDCERDLKMLRRHRLIEPDGSCYWCREFRWPCVHIRDLAEAYGVEVPE